MLKKIIGLVIPALLLCVPGCSSHSVTKSFVRENASLAHIQHVAVLPFAGGGKAQRVREYTMTQLLASGTFDVVDKGLVDSVLAQEVIGADTPIDASTIRRLGQLLNVQAFIVGSVEQSNVTRGNAAFAEIIMTLRLIDSETGIILWQASGRGSGYSLADRLFGMAPKDSFTVTMGLLDDLFKTMR